MKNVIITGASGMIGGLILKSCLADPEIATVTVLVRSATGIESEKLREVVHEDFNNYSGIEGYFENQDIAYYCIGVYTGAVPADQFRMITVDYTRAFAETLKRHSPAATFCFLSGQGADQTEKSRMMFARDKGVAENILMEMNFGQTYIFRPAYIYPSTPRIEPNLTYRIMRRLYPVFKMIYPNGAISSIDLARVMFLTGLNGGEETIFENSDMKKLI